MKGRWFPVLLAAGFLFSGGAALVGAVSMEWRLHAERDSLMGRLAEAAGWRQAEAAVKQVESAHFPGGLPGRLGMTDLLKQMEQAVGQAGVRLRQVEPDPTTGVAFDAVLSGPAGSIEQFLEALPRTIPGAMVSRLELRAGEKELVCALRLEVVG